MRSSRSKYAFTWYFYLTSAMNYFSSSMLSIYTLPRRFELLTLIDSLCGATESHVWQKRDVWGRPVAHVVAFPQWGSWLRVAQNGSEWKICVLSRINTIIYLKNLWTHLSTTLFLPPVFFQQKNAVLTANCKSIDSFWFCSAEGFCLYSGAVQIKLTKIGCGAAQAWPRAVQAARRHRDQIWQDVDITSFAAEDSMRARCYARRARISRHLDNVSLQSFFIKSKAHL